jgi:endogenous inhibitor of DNA gyrase (YacG/DUF329 family)
MPLSPVTLQGPVDAVPCSHCGTPQNYGELEQLVRGMDVECDHCGKISEVIDIRKVIVVRQSKT